MKNERESDDENSSSQITQRNKAVDGKKRSVLMGLVKISIFILFFCHLTSYIETVLMIFDMHFTSCQRQRESNPMLFNSFAAALSASAW